MGDKRISVKQTVLCGKSDLEGHMLPFPRDLYLFVVY